MKKYLIAAAGLFLISPAFAAQTHIATICNQKNFILQGCDFLTDGIDDDVEIQLAINIVSSINPPGATQGGGGGKGLIIFKEGTYVIGSSIFIRPGIHFKGQGLASTVLKAKDGLNDTMFKFKESSVNPSAGVIFEDLYFNGNRENNVSGGAIDTKVGAVALWDLHLTRCLFFDFADTILMIRDPWGFRMFECHLEDSDKGGVFILADGEKRSGPSIIDSKIIQVGQKEPASAVQLNGVNGARIIGNELNSSGFNKYAVELINSSQNMIIGNNVYSGTSGFFTDYNSHANIFIGNALGGLSGNGIIIFQNSNHNVVEGNTFFLIQGAEIYDQGNYTIRQGNRGENDNPLDMTNVDATYNRVGIGTNLAEAQFHIKNSNFNGSLPVLLIEQDQNGKSFISVKGNSSSGNSGSVSTDTTENGLKGGAVKIEVNGQTKWLRFYDEPF